jgi:N-acylglucosamine 2-epimerase
MRLSLNRLPQDQADRLREHYRKSLLDDVIPWWERHSLDRECGGYFSLLERDGHPFATDKYMWTTGREIWMFSHLCNRHAARPEWLAVAQHGADFLLRHAFREDGKMHFRLTREGQSRAEVLSIYTECFGAIALAELSKAAGNPAYWRRAVEMYERIRPRLGVADNTSMLGYPIHAEFHLHVHDMIRITVAWVFDELYPEDRWKADLAMSVDSLLSKHWRPELGALLENVGIGGTPLLDLPEGRMVHPGHAIESAWMLMDIAVRNGDGALMDTAVKIALASLEHGWDAEYGGIRYLTNLDWTPTHPLEADLKLWWPHCEALYALLLAWAYTGRDDVAQWYQKVHDYSFQRFGDPEYGEWFGYLNRDGSRVWTAKANGWKGCFHLPRVLFRCYGLLQEAAHET